MSAATITPLRCYRTADLLLRRSRRTARVGAFSGTIFRRRPVVEFMEDRMLLSTFVVSSTADSGPGSFRQAILDSNAATGGTSAIDFAITGTGVQTIAPLSPLPAITGRVVIDGTSQMGYAGTPLIELGGAGRRRRRPDDHRPGCDRSGPGHRRLRGGYRHPPLGRNATGDTIQSNVIGSDPTGSQQRPNNYGVRILWALTTTWWAVPPPPSAT